MYQSQHATIRSQQRGVSPLIIDLLLMFGARDHAGDGAEICYFDRRAKKKVSAYVGGAVGKLNEALDTYAIVSNDKVITVGTRYKRIPNN